MTAALPIDRDTQGSPLTSGDVQTADGLLVHYVECGRGPPVVLIHGSGNGASGKSNFEANMRAFASAGRRAIALDLFGYGASSKPTDRIYDLTFHVSAVTALLRGLGLDQIDLIGNSLGGAVALRLAMDRPERVRRLVLMAPGGLASKLRYLRMPGIRAMMTAQLGWGGPTFEKLKKVFRLQVYDSSRLPEAVILERLEVARTQPRQVYKTLRVENLVSRLPEVKCPTLGFWGTEDKFCPVGTAPLLARGIPDCRVILVGRCGHWVQVEHADLFNRECLQFLE